MNTWNRLTDLRGEGWEGLEEISQTHVCVSAQPTDSDSDVVKAGGGSLGGGHKVGRGQETSTIMSTIKSKIKN